MLPAALPRLPLATGVHPPLYPGGRTPVAGCVAAEGGGEIRRRRRDGHGYAGL